MSHRPPLRYEDQPITVLEIVVALLVLAALVVSVQPLRLIVGPGRADGLRPP